MHLNQFVSIAAEGDLKPLLFLLSPEFWVECKQGKHYIISKFLFIDLLSPES